MQEQPSSEPNQAFVPVAFRRALVTIETAYAGYVLLFTLPAWPQLIGEIKRGISLPTDWTGAIATAAVIAFAQLLIALAAWRTSRRVVRPMRGRLLTLLWIQWTSIVVPSAVVMTLYQMIALHSFDSALTIVGSLFFGTLMLALPMVVSAMLLERSTRHFEVYA